MLFKAQPPVQGETSNKAQGTDDSAPEGVQPATRIFLVDDHTIFREALEKLLNCEPGLGVCGGADDHVAAVAGIASSSPDLVIMDLELPTCDGFELLKEIRAGHPNLRVLILSMFEASTYAERAIRAGAHGYVMKQSGLNELLKAIHTVRQQDIYISGSIAAQLLRKLSGAGATRKEENAIDQLSNRELQVLRFIGQGLTVRDIAERLYVSPKTIESHRENMKRKLGLSSANELLRYAIGHLPGGD